ncbi:MAG: OprO/OprP family phosphate-selective porin [bacterium]|nr:OprO/OprP family phosphate-selective porin [bacterium]
MKQFLILIAVLCFVVPNVTAKAESEILSPVVLGGTEISDVVTVEKDKPKKTLQEKLNDVYNSEISNNDTFNFMFSDILTKHFDNKSPIEKMRFWSGYRGYTNLTIPDEHSFLGNYEFSAINVGVDGNLKDNKADYRIMLNYSPHTDKTLAQNMFSDVYLGTNKISNTRIQVGHFRPARGVEGKMSGYLIPFLARSQISRNFATARKIGGKVVGDYDLFDYDIGIYNSDTYFRSFFPGAEFDGWVNLKPLGKTNGKYGEIKIGGGLQAGKRDFDYTVTGTYAEYTYKKFMVNFEWAKADGYNGLVQSNNKADGFYTTVKYDITPKLRALLRYDEFSPNKAIKNGKNREYSAGLNYYIKGTGLMLMLNYIFCQNYATKDSHKILIGTQVLL